MKENENPFCPDCGYRTYPQWGPHDCQLERSVSSDEDLVRKTRHTAGDILTNLHFYRIPAGMQVAGLAEALAFSIASNIHPARIKSKWIAIHHLMIKLIDTQVFRQQKGTNAENIVMDVNKPRLRVKVKKEHTHGDKAKKSGRQNRQAVPTRRTRRH